MNSRIPKHEWALIKGALRRVFSRSELRRQALSLARVNHSDPKRPRVKTWYRCPLCHGYFAQAEMNVDHVIPVVPLDKSLEEMSADDIVNRIWCDKENLMAICKPCHTRKSSVETKERRLRKKKKNGK